MRSNGRELFGRFIASIAILFIICDIILSHQVSRVCSPFDDCAGNLRCLGNNRFTIFRFEDVNEEKVPVG